MLIQPEPHPMSKNLRFFFLFISFVTISIKTSVSGLGIKTFFETSKSKFQKLF